MTEAVSESDQRSHVTPRGAAVIQFGIFCCAVTMVIVLAVAIGAAG